MKASDGRLALACITIALHPRLPSPVKRVEVEGVKSGRREGGTKALV
jgi:hypothetical protein